MKILQKVFLLFHVSLVAVNTMHDFSQCKTNCSLHDSNIANILDEELCNNDQKPITVAVKLPILNVCRILGYVSVKLCYLPDSAGRRNDKIVSIPIIDIGNIRLHK